MIRVLAFLILLFVTFDASAQEPSRVRYKLPKVETNDAGEKCLNSEKWQKVILMASEYKGLFDWRLKIDPTLIEYASLKDTYELKLKIKDEQIALLKEDREYLQLRLGQSEKARTAHTTSYKIEKGIMWAVIAVETVVIGVLGVKGVAP